MAARLSCAIGHGNPLVYVALGRSSVKSVPEDGSPLVFLEKPVSGVLGAGAYITGVNQEVVFKVPSGFYPIVTLATTGTGFKRLSCILSGTLQ